MDTNVRVAGYLRDMSAIHPSTHGRASYERAAVAVLHLEEPLEDLRQAGGTLRKIPAIGESSARIILEVLTHGTSATVERAMTGSPRAAEAAKSRAARDQFMSRVEAATVLRDSSLKGVTTGAYRGDLQMHSTWSDGRESIAAMIEGCLARGYSYCAVTDHSDGLPINRGLTAEKTDRQHQEIDALNREYAGRFRVLKGIEANMAADGVPDVPAAARRRMDIVLAAPHSQLRIADDQTERLLRAVVTPGVHILAHPRGRQFGSRAGIAADWDLVFAAAAKYGVAIELDGDPWRQDLDWTIARRALDAGCVFALDSDAHATSELWYADMAIAHARRADIPEARVLNCWHLDELSAWATQAWDKPLSPPAFG